MVTRLLRRDGVPIRHRPPPPSGDWLYDQHIVKRRTLTAIANETGVHPGAVCLWKQRHQLAARDDTPVRARRPMNKRSAQSILKPWVAAGVPACWLQLFVGTLRYSTMHAAATDIGINQATLRYRIRALERIFNGPLLFRARHGLALRPTALGEQVAQAIPIVVGREASV